ncbi:MAG: DNA cytosine methyltransferase, partial [Candidatus Fonsibacter sp.]
MSTPEVDLYVAGPPCQPWSAMGQQRGLNDIRGTVFYQVLHFVRQRPPRVAFIENVRGLLARHPCELFDVVQIIKESGYCVTWDIVNTAHHGIPQSRPRLCIVAIRADSCARTLKFPKKLNALPSVDLFLKRGKPRHGEPQLELLRLLPDN